MHILCNYIQKYIIIMSFDANIKKYANKGINSRV